jgi:hypothetical protein
MALFVLFFCLFYVPLAPCSLLSVRKCMAIREMFGVLAALQIGRPATA